MRSKMDVKFVVNHHRNRAEDEASCPEAVIAAIEVWWVY